MRRLSAADRDLVVLVAAGALANPFGDDRESIDEVLAAAADRVPPEERLARVVARAEALFTRLRARAFDPITLPPEDRDVYEAAALFVVFHRYTAAFDTFIRQQLAAGRTSLPVPFARSALADLVTLGIPPADAPRYLAIFFQMRRAFYFVDTTLAGTSASMRQLRERLWQNIFTSDLLLYVRVMWNRMEDFSTLLLGETGTGKGAAAAAIGRSGYIPFDEKSGRFVVSFTESFLAINLSQYPEALLESELFGHKRGAFTGALETHTGVFGRSSLHGAIFLDEIGETSIPTQIKLLRVLQERTFSPVGMHETVRFEGRVIAATHRSLAERRRRRRFRDDFYYRLSSDVIELPTLRTRLAEDDGELPTLLQVIVRRTLGNDAPDIAAEVGSVIEETLGPSYGWPGNVRELEQCVRRVLLRGSYGGDDSRPPARVRAVSGERDDISAHERLLDATGGGSVDATELLARYCRALHLELGTYEQVARRTGLDRRTVKKYIGTTARPS